MAKHTFFNMTVPNNIKRDAHTVIINNSVGNSATKEHTADWEELGSRVMHHILDENDN